jgi:hypothetical protein
MRQEPEGFDAFWTFWREHKRPDGRKRLGECQAFFREVVLPFSGDECVPWPYTRNGAGYGQVSVNGRMKDVHRVICVDVHGAAPSPIHEAAHSCGRKECANPRHISWKTPLENAADKYLHGTIKSGERNPACKLTDEQAAAVKALRRVIPIKEAAQRFGISISQVSRIQNGKQRAA